MYLFSPAEDHFKNYIDKARQMNKHIVLAGCVPQGAPKSAYMKVRKKLFFIKRRKRKNTPYFDF